MSNTRNPVEGMQIGLEAFTPYGQRRKFTVTPIPENKEIFDYTVKLFSNLLWADLQHLKQPAPKSSKRRK